jgi:SAM-dependent methyltransferase
MSLDDIDFGERYRRHMAAAGGREKPPEVWDARARDMTPALDESAYVRAFVRRMDLFGCETLLDVGCGSGAIALAVAPCMKRVYGLDYSRGMLDRFMENAAAQGATQAQPILRAWEDDWSDVPECDIVVASRSTAVMDMEAALRKLDAKARRRVYLTNLAGGRFVDAEVVALLGRTQPPLPDYIYIVNLLHRMGRQPRLDYIESVGRLAGSADFETFARKVAFSLGRLDAAEHARLAEWYAADPQRARRGGSLFRWAFIAWETGRA